MHEIVRECLPRFESFTKDGKLIVEYTGKKNKKIKKKEECSLLFTLHKKHIDTQMAVQKVSKLVNKRPNDFTTAGIKDKRGVTTQRVWCRKLTSDHLMRQRVGKNWPDELEVSDFVEGAKQLHVGDLYGNQFKLVLRMFGSSEANHVEVKKRLQDVESNGFVNYFGLQRFGLKENSRTHQIGRLIVTHEYENAFTTILMQDYGMKDVQEAKKKYLQDWNHDAMLRALPRSCVSDKLTNQFIERSMIESMKKNKDSGKNWLQALIAIPKGIRNLYPHAFQSYIWNKTVSLRLENYGHTVVEGDMVFDDSEGFIIVDGSNKNHFKITDVIIPLLGSNTK